jgi:NAD(P)H-hydrate epimerase
LSKSKSGVVGPGLGEDAYADALMRTLFGFRGTRRSGGVGFRQIGASEPTVDVDRGNALIGLDKPSVIDADGLNWLAKQPEWWAGSQPFSLVLTPHIGEMTRLTGKSAEEILENPASVAAEAARSWRQVVVLKHGFTIATDGETSYAVPEVALSLATAGAGDVLAGAIGAFLAQGLAPLDAAGLAIYLGTRAAKRTEERYGVLGLTAGDLPVAIAEEIAVLERKRDETRG